MTAKRPAFSRGFLAFCVVLWVYVAVMLVASIAIGNARAMLPSMALGFVVQTWSTVGVIRHVRKWGFA